MQKRCNQAFWFDRESAGPTKTCALRSCACSVVAEFKESNTVRLASTFEGKLPSSAGRHKSRVLDAISRPL